MSNWNRPTGEEETPRPTTGNLVPDLPAKAKANEEVIGHEVGDKLAGGVFQQDEIVRLDQDPLTGVCDGLFQIDPDDLLSAVDGS